MATSVVDELVEYGQLLIRVEQDTVRAGRPVEPRLVVVTPTGHWMVAAIPMLPETSEAREAIFKALVAEYQGVAVLVFDDAHLREADTLAVAGEALVALIQTRAGESYVLTCRYARDPVTFAETALAEALPVYNFWSTTVH